MKIILASESPRRKALLAAAGILFEAVPSNFDEQLDDSRPSEVVAQELALGKAREVAARFPDACVIGADTIVALDGVQLGKPKDAAEAHRMLRSLSGRANAVTTGVAVVCKSQGVERTASQTTLVYFKDYDAALVRDYLATGDSLDKAGAYGIQSGAAALIDHIEGDYDVVVGLPVQLMLNMVANAVPGCDLVPHG